MKRTLEGILASITGCLILMPTQQAIAQVVVEPASTEMEQNISATVVENIHRFLLPAPLDTELRELILPDGKPVLQNDIPVGLGLGSDTICSSEDRLSEATGSADNGDGTVRFIAEDTIGCQQ